MREGVGKKLLMSGTGEVVGLIAVLSKNALRLANEGFHNVLCNVTADYFYMKDGKDLIVRLPREAGGRYFSHNQLLWNQRSPNKLPCAKRGGSSEELNSHLLMSWSGDDVVTSQILMEDVQSIGGVHFVGMSRGLIEERADGWQKVAAITVLCIIGGEIALLLAAIAAVQFIAKPRIRRYKEQLGIVYKKKKRALKERALKRLRKLRMRKLRAKRRHLREQRRREEKGGSQSSSSSSSCSSCSFESTGFTKPTTLDARTGQRDGLQTNFNAQKTPQAEASKKNVADLVEAHEVSALAQQRRFGVDKTTTQAPEPTGDGTGMTRGANIHNSQLQQK
ncbi:unnamed protein product [Toxocara canis]|uniref:Ion_trans_2 domain-containing protein n=1 Tax=Toxocara canis TaxID=6265 RepID=A0A183V699_TOXCA|nr:unnamed protein product [Toxocara canis]